MFHSSPARWLAVIPIAAAALAAAAQPTPAPAARAPAVPAYKSAFEGYQPFADAQPIPWKEANETVHRRGGWRAYAKEAAGPSEGGAAADPHAGHARPAPPAAEKKP
ncbi:hypothetical protein M2165_000253 [Variovorax sp. TBS-050B]|uniref:hypothetical protein n=1 Tax=Variovorax sp. TBS-050B TaxID=2940551 RepID=UPI002474FBC4|nr:hypothetical protein [Variovorax sp. TBS-050B]MDH6590364.1 hypothetical protein [Variovorax sp. TBS-050B]